MPNASELKRGAEALRPLLHQHADLTDSLRRLPDETVAALRDAGPVPADGAQALRRLPDEHPHIYRGDGGARPRMRLDVLGRQPDQRLRVAGGAVSRARAAGHLGREPRRVDRRIARAARRRESRRRRMAGDGQVDVGLGFAARAVGGVRHPHEQRRGRDRELRPVAHADVGADDRGHVVRRRA